VDDEPLARQRLRDLLAVVPGVQHVAEAASGRAAVQAIRQLVPDVVFLDVQMPGLSGLDVVQKVGPEAMPATVFVTAYDHHAIAAFDAAAVDYLLKPFEDTRFYRAFERARTDAQRRAVPRGAGETRAPDFGESAGHPARLAQSAQTFAARIAVEARGVVRFVAVADIDYVTADGPYAVLHTGGERHIVREPMHALEARLDPAVFARIHRSTILRLDRVERLVVAAGGDYQACLRDGTRLRVSRSRYDALMAQLSALPRS